MLTSGAVDYQTVVNRDQVKSLSKNKNVKVYKIKTWYNYLMFFNTQKAPLNKVAVRQALSYAVPYKDVIKIGAGGYAVQSRGPVPMGLWPNGTKTKLPQYSYNLKKADQMLTAAGYPKSKRGSIKMTLTYAAENTLEKAFCPLIKESFKKLGISVSVSALLWNSQYAKAVGPASNRQDLFVILWWPTPDGYDNLTSLFQTEKTPAWNFAYWYNKAYDNLVLKAYKLNATNPKAAQALFTTAQKTNISQAPAAYLFDSMTIVAALKNIKFVYKGGLGAGNANYPMVQFWYYTGK
jgi:peptide/nickel transport system substrate-binding protein